MNVTRITLKEALWRWQRGIARALLLAGALAGMTLGTVAHAQIAFRNASSAAALAAPAAPTVSSGTASSTTGTITFGTSTNAENGGGSNSLTINKPSGVSNGDLLLAHITFEKGSDAGSDAQITPSGWTLVRRTDRGTDIGQAIFHRVVTDAATEPASYTWNFSQSVKAAGGILRYSGVAMANPIIASSGGTGSGSTLTAPSVASEAGSMLVALFGLQKKNVTMSTPTGMAERYLFQNPDDVRIKAADETGPANPTGNRVSNAGSGDKWVAQLVTLRRANVLTITKPSGTASGNVLVASIGFRPQCCDTPTANYTITPLDAGWTLLRRLDNVGASNSLAVYWKVAGASEPAAYRWSFSVSGTDPDGDTTKFDAAAGGILKFSGVETVAPISGTEENGAPTPFGTSHATPSITTPAVNTMLVASYGIANPGPNHWTMADTSLSWTEALEPTAGGEAVAMYYAVKPTVGNTGTITANSAAGDIGNAHILALRSATPGTALTIPIPQNTVAGDVMIASVAVRAYAASPCPSCPELAITPPLGWDLVRETTREPPNPVSRQAFYIRAAGASEPASYTWTLGAGNDGGVGGILSFSGVDTTAPVVNNAIDNHGGNVWPNNGDGKITANSINTTVRNTVAVSAHSFTSSTIWTPAADVNPASRTPQSTIGISLAMYHYPEQAGPGPTGDKTATSTGDYDSGIGQILALRPRPATGVAGGFNAYDTSTAAGATSGFVKTKIAGSTVSVAIIALNLPGTAIETTFTSTVKVEVLDASNNTGALDGNGCRPTWTVLQTLSNPTFVAGDNGRKTVSFTQANSYPDLRLRVSYPTTSPTRIGCSNDNFALRPDQFTFTVTDADWETAGTTRTLNNVAVPGGITHKAGRPFTVQATAVNGAGTPATTTNYAGTPTTTLTDCGGSSACPSTMGTLTLVTNFVAGVLTTNAASYDNVGSFNLELRDTTFANVDAGDGTAADCSASGRYVCSSTLGVGRFVPDNFAVALNTPSFGTACGSFTYMGQKFNYATAPVITLTARNFAGGTTANYAGGLWQITNASLTGKSYAAAAPGTLDVSGLPGTDPVIFDAGGGTGTLTFGSGTGLSFSRTTPVAPFDADIGLSINVIDADGVAYASNPARFGQATPGNGIAFTSGKPLRFGRLTLRNANGSQLLPLSVPVEAQYWSGAPINGFLTNTLDSCTTIASANDAMGNYTGNLSGSPTCETAITSGGTLSAGRGILVLAAPGSGNGGSVDLTVNLGAAASGNTCTTQGGAPGSATTANLPHLQGNWSGGGYDQNPTARATFGISRGAEEVVFTRENF